MRITSNIIIVGTDGEALYVLSKSPTQYTPICFDWDGTTRVDIAEHTSNLLGLSKQWLNIRLIDYFEFTDGLFNIFYLTVIPFSIDFRNKELPWIKISHLPQEIWTQVHRNLLHFSQ